MWNAKFRAFQLLAELAEVLLPDTRQLSAEQADAIHEYADKLAKELTSGEYAYPKKEEA